MSDQTVDTEDRDALARRASEAMFARDRATSALGIAIEDVAASAGGPET